MLFAKVLVLFAAVTVSAQVNVVSGDLKKIDADIRTLKAAISGWDGTLGGSVTIQNDEQQLDKDLKATTTDIQRQGAVSCADVAAQIQYVSSTLEPDLRSTLDVLVSRKADFAKVGLTTSIRNDLQQLKTDIDPILTYLINAACTAALKTTVQNLKTKIDNEIIAAINAFGGSSRVKRTSAQILALLQQCDSLEKKLAADLNAWDGSVAGAAAIQNDEQQLEKCYDSVATQIKKEGVSGTSADSAKICGYLNNPFEPDLKSYVVAFNNKKAYFAKDGLTATYNNDLSSLKTKVDAMCNALIAYVSSDQKSSCNAAKVKIDNDFGSPVNPATANLKRTPAQVLADLKNCDTDLKSLISLVNNWDGTVSGSVPIQNAEQQLEKCIDAATAQAKKESKANSADSQTIIGYVNNNIEPDTKAVINALIKKKAQTAKVGLTSTVHNDCVALKTKSDSLANALIAIASSDQVSNAEAAKTKIDNDLQNCLNNFPASRKLTERTPAQVLADLQTVDSDCKRCAALINSWDGSVAGAVAIQNCEQQLEKDLDATENQAKQEPVASSADSQKIINYINNTLEPDCKAFLTVLIKRKADFQKDGLESTVHNDLVSVKGKVDGLGNTLIADASSDQKSNAKAALAKLDADLQTALNNFP